MFWRKRKVGFPVKVTRGNFLKPDPVTDDDILYDVDDLPGSSSLDVEEIRNRILNLLSKGREVRQRDIPRQIGWREGGNQVNDVIDLMVSERSIKIRLSSKRTRMVSRSK